MRPTSTVLVSIIRRSYERCSTAMATCTQTLAIALVKAHRRSIGKRNAANNGGPKTRGIPLRARRQDVSRNDRRSLVSQRMANAVSRLLFRSHVRRDDCRNQRRESVGAVQGTVSEQG